MKIVRLQLLLLTAGIALAAFVPAVATAEKTTKVYSVQSNGFLETGASSKQSFRVGELEASCEGVILKSPKEYTIGHYSKISVHPEYPKCTGTLGLMKAPATVSTTGCAYEASQPVGEFNLWTANLSLVNLEKSECAFVIKSLCEVKIPTALNKNLPEASVKNFNEEQSATKTDELWVKIEIQSQPGIATGCGGGEKITGKYTGEALLKRVVVLSK